MKTAVQYKVPTPKTVKHGKFVRYQCPLCSSELQKVEDNYDKLENHVAYDCFNCGYEWIES